MSVIVSERGEGKLQVLTDSLDLVSYSIHKCKNETNFPKRSRWLLTINIVEEAKAQFDCIRRANCYDVANEIEFQERHRLQVEAYSHLELLLSYLEIAYKELSLPANCVEFWTKKILTVEKLLQGWKNTDTKRHNNEA